MRQSVLGVIQSRMGSTRLPGKALLNVGPCTLLEAVIKRAKLSKKIDRLILATTEKSEDDVIADRGVAMGLPVVRGACDDVLGRFLKALEIYPSDALVRITGDNPLTDPFMLDRLIEHYQGGDFDFCQIVDPPYGAGTDIFKGYRLREAAKKTDNPGHREHIISYFIDFIGELKTLPLLPAPEEVRPDVRLTVDTEEDLKRMRGLIGRLTDFPYSSMAEIISLSDTLEK